MPASFPIRNKVTSRTPALKEAIVSSFALDRDAARMRLAAFEVADWQSVLWWLDISGMAIYFYRRSCEIAADSLLPASLETALAERLSNNRLRMKSLLDETRMLAAWFQRGNIPYALLKGVTLTPHSVEESALRSQADLDFLIAERFADLAAHYVQRLGYRLRARSKNTLEFRAGSPTAPDLANIYSVKTQRALEIHLARPESCETHVLSRRRMREFGDARIYALSPADILVEQARHLLKHLCGEHTRLSWVLEFWRHVTSRRGDVGFWCAAESAAAACTDGDLAMGVAVWLAEAFFGGIQGQVSPRWRAEALGFRVRLWLEHYARTLLLSDAIGTKLYALLRREVPGCAEQPRTICQLLLPRVLPSPILEAQSQETAKERWTRYWVEVRVIARRLWFHLREGIRFAVEASRWNRTVARIGR